MHINNTLVDNDDNSNPQSHIVRDLLNKLTPSTLLLQKPYIKRSLPAMHKLFQVFEPMVARDSS